MAPSKSSRATGTDNGNRRQRILDIATEEFATKGLAGTRVDVIAQKARCNKQLIYYYFKSKENLYDEVLASMMAQTRAETPPDAEPSSLAEVVRRRDTGSRTQRRWRRLLMWEALDAKKGKIVREPERTLVWRRRVAELQELQRRGELDPDFDAEMLAVATYAVLLFPRMLPQIAKMTSGIDPESPEFIERYDAMVAALAAKLAPPPAKRTGRRSAKVPTAG
jgi:TetR/AcrR family transcriptional regulator